jgi:glutaredoxin-related protein
MARKQLDPANIHPDAASKLAERHPETIAEIEAAIAENKVVVVGMAQNPHVKNVRKALTEAGVEINYLEYGSYFSEWSRRLTIKLWSGWPTFPQVFVRGVLIGGEDLTKAALANGTLAARLEPATA